MVLASLLVLSQPGRVPLGLLLGGGGHQGLAMANKRMGPLGEWLLCLVQFTGLQQADTTVRPQPPTHSPYPAPPTSPFG